MDCNHLSPQLFLSKNSNKIGWLSQTQLILVAWFLNLTIPNDCKIRPLERYILGMIYKISLLRNMCKLIILPLNYKLLKNVSWYNLNTSCVVYYRCWYASPALDILLLYDSYRLGFRNEIHEEVFPMNAYFSLNLFVILLAILSLILQGFCFLLLENCIGEIAHHTTMSMGFLGENVQFSLNHCTGDA